MKNIILITASILLLTSCVEKPSGTSTKKTTMDIITVVDNGTTYADTIMFKRDPGGIVITADSLNNDTQNVLFICTIQKATDKSLFTLNYRSNISPGFPVAIAISKAAGPLSGIGVYKAYHNDAPEATKASGGDIAAGSTFTENFSSGKKYTVDSVLVNISKASGTAVAGNYQMWLSDSSGSKTVTGTINWDNAIIN